MFNVNGYTNKFYLKRIKNGKFGGCFGENARRARGKNG